MAKLPVSPLHYWVFSIRHNQTQSNTHRHRHNRHNQTHTDTVRHNQTQSDTIRHNETKSDKHRHTQTQSDTNRHTHLIALLWTSEQLVAEAATYKTQQRKQQRSCHRRDSKPQSERPQTKALESMATLIGFKHKLQWWNIITRNRLQGKELYTVKI